MGWFSVYPLIHYFTYHFNSHCVLLRRIREYSSPFICSSHSSTICYTRLCCWAFPSGYGHSGGPFDVIDVNCAKRINKTNYNGLYKYIQPVNANCDQNGILKDAWEKLTHYNMSVISPGPSKHTAGCKRYRLLVINLNLTSIIILPALAPSIVMSKKTLGFIMLMNACDRVDGNTHLNYNSTYRNASTLCLFRSGLYQWRKGLQPITAFSAERLQNGPIGMKRGGVSVMLHEMGRKMGLCGENQQIECTRVQRCVQLIH